MGQEIFYCDGCKSLVRSSELEKGKARRVDDRILCADCAGPLAAPSPLPHTGATPKALPGAPSTRRAVAPPQAKRFPFLWILAALGLAGVGIAVAVGSSARPRPNPAAEKPAPPPPPPPVIVAPQVPRPVPPLPPAPPSRAALEAEAAAALEAAKARAKEAFEAEIAGLIARGAYGEALERLERAGAKERAASVQADARRAFPAIRDRAVDARRRKADADVRAAETEVDRWKLADLAQELRAALAAADPPSPPVPAPAAGPSAMETAVSRDYEAAIREAKSPEEADAIRAAGTVYAETLQLLSRWPKGQKLAAEYLDLTGERREVDDPVLRTTAAWAEVKKENGSRFVEFSEILPGSLAAIWLKRASRPDPRSAALFLIFEGEVEAASKLAPPASIPDRIGSWARSRSRDAPREAEARRRFAEAEALWVPLATRGESAGRYRSLLAELGDTDFVRRRRSILSARAEPPKEYLFDPEDLAAGGGFRLSTEKLGACWSIGTAGGTLDAEFWCPGGTELRAWAYVGACCVEYAPFALQGTELPETPLRPRSTPVTRTHSGHQNRKPGLTWSWTPLPLPRYAEGRKTIRLSSAHPGFSVAWIVVSASREAPPTDADLKELARARSENPPGLRLGTRSLYRAFNLNGPPVMIDGRAWEGKGAKDLTASGDAFENQGIALDPPADGDRARMIRSSIYSRDGSVVTLAGVPPGRYQVYLHVWEDNNAQTFDLFVKGKLVQSRYCSGAGGHWDRLGPWTVDVADGVVGVRASAGDANFSGLEVWRIFR